jgi:hypothetical protein
MGVTVRRAAREDGPTIAEIWHLEWRDGHLWWSFRWLSSATTP